MKIAIHTISDDTNFGNRLQNYALKKGLEADNLNVFSRRLCRKYFLI